MVLFCTPNFFGFNADAGPQYRGRLDDVKMNASAENRNTNLLNAMRQIAQTGNGPKKQIASMGCSIKWRKYHASYCVTIAQIFAILSSGKSP